MFSYESPPLHSLAKFSVSKGDCFLLIFIIRRMSHHNGNTAIVFCITVILPNLPNELHVAKKWNSPFCGNWLSILGCQSFIPDPWFFPGNQHHKYISCCDYLLAEQYYYSLWVFKALGKVLCCQALITLKNQFENKKHWKKINKRKKKETLGMLFTAIESVGKSIVLENPYMTHWPYII